MAKAKSRKGSHRASAKARIPLAICYDFDGTLVPGNMQEHTFIPKIGMVSGDFWKEVIKESRRNNAGNILVYMGLMLERAQAAKVPVSQADIRSHGNRLRFFPG